MVGTLALEVKLLPNFLPRKPLSKLWRYILCGLVERQKETIEGLGGYSDVSLVQDRHLRLLNGCATDKFATRNTSQFRDSVNDVEIMIKKSH